MEEFENVENWHYRTAGYPGYCPFDFRTHRAPEAWQSHGQDYRWLQKGVSETDFDDEVEDASESKKSKYKKSKVKVTEDKPVKKKKAKPVEESEDEDETDEEDGTDSEDDE